MAEASYRRPDPTSAAQPHGRQVLHLEPSSPSGPSPLEWVLRSLLRVRGLEETERVVLDLVRAATTAKWGALYVASSDGLTLRRCSPDAHAPQIRDLIPADVCGALLDGWNTPVLWPEGMPRRDTIAPDVQVIAPLELPDGSGALLALGPKADGPYRLGDLTVLHPVVDSCAVALGNAQRLDRLRSEVSVDFLTGCYNRRAFDRNLEVEIGRSRRYQRPLSLLLVDIDHFKWVNDTMGHPAGDHALRRVGEFLRETFRATDWVCRFGGDEFGIIFPETPREDAARLADRLRRGLGALFPDTVIRRAVTASVGVAAFPEDGRGPGPLLESTDRALYRAKGAGRNRVVVA